MACLLDFYWFLLFALPLVLHGPFEISHVVFVLHPALGACMFISCLKRAVKIVDPNMEYYC